VVVVTAAVVVGAAVVEGAVVDGGIASDGSSAQAASTTIEIANIGVQRRIIESSFGNDDRAHRRRRHGMPQRSAG
jgi:hypothetical protein